MTSDLAGRPHETPLLDQAAAGDSSRSAILPSSQEQHPEDDMGELKDKVAVITGAGSGMARASTNVFVREGARVVAADISGREHETAAELGDAVVPFRCDVTKEDQVQA